MVHNEIQSLRTLINSFTMDIDSPALINKMKSRLEKTYEKALKDVHTNKIFQLADGRWKT